MKQLATGLRAWVMQRLSAIYLGIFIVYLLGVFLTSPPADYQAWRAFVSQPLISVGLLLLYASLLIHAWVGIRDILIDYIHPVFLRLSLLSLFALMLLATTLWAFETIVLARLAG